MALNSTTGGIGTAMDEQYLKDTSFKQLKSTYNNKTLVEDDAIKEEHSHDEEDNHNNE